MTHNSMGSRGLARWLHANRLSFACSSDEIGLLVLFRSHVEGAVAICRCAFDRAMGLGWRPGRIHLAARQEIRGLENILKPHAPDTEGHDAMLVPRDAQMTGSIDTHELVVSPGADGKPAYVVAAARSDSADSWRDRCSIGGAVVEAGTGRFVCGGLSLPHSPGLSSGMLILLASQRGQIVKLDPATRERKDVASCHGALRDLALKKGDALVSLSKPREASFAGLPIDEQLSIVGNAPWCGVPVVELAIGNIIEWLRLHGTQSALLDVMVMSATRHRTMIAPRSAEAKRTLTFEPLAHSAPPPFFSLVQES